MRPVSWSSTEITPTPVHFSLVILELCVTEHLKSLQEDPNRPLESGSQSTDALTAVPWAGNSKIGHGQEAVQGSSEFWDLLTVLACLEEVTWQSVDTKSGPRSQTTKSKTAWSSPTSVQLCRLCLQFTLLWTSVLTLKSHRDQLISHLFTCTGPFFFFWYH